jgi:hypothetical protein
MVICNRQAYENRIGVSHEPYLCEVIFKTCNSRASEAYNTNLYHETDQRSETSIIGKRMETDSLGCLMSFILFSLDLCYNM